MLQFALALALGSVAVPTQVGQVSPYDGVQSFYPRMDKLAERTVSGHKSGGRVLLGSKALATDTGNGFVVKLAWGEVLDKPVTAVVEARYAKDGQLQSVGGKHGPAPTQTRTLDFSTQHGRFIRALRVCTTERDDDTLERLKGVKVKTAVLRDGAFVAEEDVDTQELTNCKTWHEWSTCPAGQAAAQIGVYLQGSGPNEGAIRGLSVLCAPPLTIRK